MTESELRDALERHGLATHIGDRNMLIQYYIEKVIGVSFDKPASPPVTSPAANANLKTRTKVKWMLS